MARFARCDVRREAAVFVGSDETVLRRRISFPRDAFRRLLLQIGGANIAGADHAWWPPTSSSLGDGKACPLASSQHGGARDPRIRQSTLIQ
jgi:hypothetical protein